MQSSPFNIVLVNFWTSQRALATPVGEVANTQIVASAPLLQEQALQGARSWTGHSQVCRFQLKTNSPRVAPRGRARRCFLSPLRVCQNPLRHVICLLRSQIPLQPCVCLIWPPCPIRIAEQFTVWPPECAPLTMAEGPNLSAANGPRSGDRLSTSSHTGPSVIDVLPESSVTVSSLPFHCLRCLCAPYVHGGPPAASLVVI